MRKKIKKILIFFFVVFLISIITLSYLRYEALSRISDFIKIYGSYSTLDLNPFPPSLSVTNLSIEIPEKMGRLMVRNARIEVTTRRLFSKKLGFNIYLESPKFFLYKLESKGGKRRKLPNFDIESGRIINGTFDFNDGKRELTLNNVNGSFYWKNKRLGLNIKNSSGRIRDDKTGLEEDFAMKLLLRSEGERTRIRELELRSNRGIVLSKGNVYFSEGNIRAQGNIYANLSMPFRFKGINIKGNVDGKYSINKTRNNLETKMELSIESQINGRFMRALALTSMDEKLNGELSLKSSYKKNKWNLDIKFSEGKSYQFNLKNFPLDFLDFLYNKIPEGFFLNLEGTGEGEKLNGKFLLFSEEDGNLRGSIDREGGNYRVGIEEIKVKGLQGNCFINYSRNGMDISGRLTEISLKELLNSDIMKKFLSFKQFPNIEGRGEGKFQISGELKKPETNAEIELRNIRISGIDLGLLKGEIRGIEKALFFEGELKEGIFDGKVKLDLGGRRAQIEVSRGRVERIWKELKGELKGGFIISFKEGYFVDGDFISSGIRFRDLEIRDLVIPFQLKNGLFNSVFSFSTKLSKSSGVLEYQAENMRYRLRVPSLSFDISDIYKPLKGNAELSIEGEGDLYGSPLKIVGNINDLALESGEFRRFHLNSNLVLLKDKISLKGSAESFSKEDKLNFELEILKNGDLNGNFNGSLSSIEKLVEFPGEGVRAKFLGEIKGNINSPKIRSLSNIEGKSFFIKGFAHDFKDFSGILIQENSSLHLRNFRAKLGGGDVEGYGEARIGKWTLEDIKIDLTGKGMKLTPFEKVRGEGEGKVVIRGNLDEISIEGNLSIQNVIWRKEIGEKIAFSSTPSKGPPKIFKKINLNIELRSEGNAWMDNSWGKVEGKFSLRIIGDSSNPIILGSITGKKGELNLGDRKFNLIRGEVYFNSPFIIDPEIYILAETFVRDYRVIFEVKGKSSKPIPLLSSSPPLSPQDILSLLALGEIYQRTSYRTGTQLGSASLLSMEISEQLKSRAKKLLGVDRLRVDPYLLGSSSNPVARLTVGKKVSKDLIILYSSDLSGQREYIVYMEYNISDNLSLIGMRNENGSFSIDLKLIKRF